MIFILGEGKARGCVVVLKRGRADTARFVGNSSRVMQDFQVIVIRSNYLCLGPEGVDENVRFKLGEKEARLHVKCSFQGSAPVQVGARHVWGTTPNHHNFNVRVLLVVQVVP